MMGTSEEMDEMVEEFGKVARNVMTEFQVASLERKMKILSLVEAKGDGEARGMENTFGLK